MSFIAIPTEQTTAATDALLAVVALSIAICLRRRGLAGMRGRLWRSVFYLLATASVLGTVAHGFVQSKAFNDGIWDLLYLVLALVVAMFVLATTLDVVGPRRSCQLRPVVLLIAAGFYAYVLVYPESFLPFVLYEALAMLLALAGYAWLAIKGSLPGAAWLAAGIATTIIAAAIQADGSLEFTFIWVFDHNGIYHLVQIPALLLLLTGLHKSMAGS